MRLMRSLGHCQNLFRLTDFVNEGDTLNGLGWGAVRGMDGWFVRRMEGFIFNFFFCSLCGL